MKVAMELLKEGNLKVYEVADAAAIQIQPISAPSLRK